MQFLSNRLARVLFLACALVLPHEALVAPSLAGSTEVRASAPYTTRAVAGSGVHYLATAVIHAQQPTPTGMVQRSTETVELEGDLRGRVLYHPTSVFDFANGTLVNTGKQVFSGTVLGSAPVLLYDDTFRFDVDLATGATFGEVHLSRSLAGPEVACDLRIFGTGVTPEGNASVDYAGECRFAGPEPR